MLNIFKKKRRDEFKPGHIEPEAYVSVTDMALDFARPYARALHFRYEGYSRDDALEMIVIWMKSRFSTFDEIDLGACMRAVDDSYDLDLEVWESKHGDRRRVEANWAAQAIARGMEE